MGGTEVYAEEMKAAGVVMKSLSRRQLGDDGRS